MEYTTNQLAVEICHRLGIKTGGKTTGNIIVHCLSPAHIDKNPSCSISLDKAIFYCFSCKYSGSLFKLYRERTGHNIEYDLGIQREYSFKPAFIEEKADLSLLPDVDFKFTGQFFPLDSTELGKNWIKSRGFNIDLMNKLSIKYLKFGRTVKASEPDNKAEWRNFSEMAIIPIYEKRKLLCFEARQLRTKDEWSKYLELKGIEGKTYKKVLYPKNSSTKTLFHYDYLDRDKPLFLVEGLMDLISLRTNELFENSTTTFGRSIKDRQFYMLNKFKEVVIIPNNDGPGITALEQFKDKSLNVKVLPLSKNYKDVNEVLQKGESLQTLVDLGWLDRIKSLKDFDTETYMKALGVNLKI